MDDSGEVLLSNGAVLHYVFAPNEKANWLNDALALHGGIPLWQYDAVFANEGNYPTMEVEWTLDAAILMQHVGVPFFWLSTYNGRGAVTKWELTQRERFKKSGATFVDIERMASDVVNLTKGEVEHLRADPHFCMPGPPDEIGLLLLRIIWALHEASHKM